MKNVSEIELKALKKLYAILIELGYDFNDFLSAKNSRIVFQKLVYSLQKCGFQLGYNYNLYINGPYSPGLASDGYLIAENLELFLRDDSPFSLSPQGKAKIQKAKDFVDDDAANRQWLETLATMDYIFTWAPVKTKDFVINRFKEIKPLLDNQEMIEKAWGKISRPQ